MDNKRRLCRLIERFVNEYRGDAVEYIYGKGTTIKVHNITFAVTREVIQIEAVIVLGDIINEGVIDGSLVEILIQDSMVYFFPKSIVKTYVRFDV